MGQVLARCERIDRPGDRPFRWGEMWQRFQRQAETDRRIAGDEEQPAAPQRPDFAQPARPRRRIRRLDRQHVAGRHRHLPLELAHDPRALDGIVDLGVAGVDVGGPLALLHHPLDRVLEGGNEIVAIDAEPCRHALGEPFGEVARGRMVLAFARDQAVVAPDRKAVLAPEQGEGPARQRLARIPFALAVMQEAAGRVTVAQPSDQYVGADALGGAERVGVPLRRLVVVDGDEGRLAAHGEADVLGCEVGIDLGAERIERGPRGVGKRKRDPRLLGDAADPHLEREIDFRRVDGAGDRRRGAVMRRCRHRQMALAAQQAGGRIEADPAGAGNDRPRSRRAGR